MSNKIVDAAQTGVIGLVVVTGLLVATGNTPTGAAFGTSVSHATGVAVGMLPDFVTILFGGFKEGDDAVHAPGENT